MKILDWIFDQLEKVPVWIIYLALIIIGFGFWKLAFKLAAHLY